MAEAAKKKPDGSLLHRQVCLGPPPPVWNERCTCGDMAVGHAALEHPGVRVPDGICGGRNLAGQCMRCGCTRFERAGSRSATNPNLSRRRAG